MPALISADSLSKTYLVRRRGGGWIKSVLNPETVRVDALAGVSFTVGEGELIGYIGQNGAGKSTTVKILSGILVPDSGACSVLGMTPWLDRMRVVARIGVVFGQRSQLWWDLPVSDSFALLRDIYRVPKAQYSRTLEELVDCLTLSPVLDTPVRQLSLGQRMRCELAASLLHSPRLLFLDEPTIGLDAVSKLAVRDFIRRRNQQDGMTVILTTHDMDDIEALCTRVLLIGQGRILMDGSVQALLADRHERRITATLERPLPKSIMPDCVSARHKAGNEWTFYFDPDECPAPRLIALLNDACGILDVIVEHPPIDEVVARRYEQMEAAP